MTRVGWTMIGLFTAVAGAFGLLQSGPPTVARSTSAPPAMLKTPTSHALVDDRPFATEGTRPIGDFGRGFAIPVRGILAAQLVDTWHQSRESGARRHEAIDIVAPVGTPVVAAFAGTVEKLHLSPRGGITAYVRSRDHALMAYYAHLLRYAPGLTEGQQIDRGGPIGFVGDTGNAGAGNYHLHFALARLAPDDKWYNGLPVNPYPVLVGRH